MKWLLLAPIAVGVFINPLGMLKLIGAFTVIAVSFMFPAFFNS